MPSVCHLCKAFHHSCDKDLYPLLEILFFLFPLKVDVSSSNHVFSMSTPQPLLQSCLFGPGAPHGHTLARDTWTATSMLGSVKVTRRLKHHTILAQN